MPTPFSHLRIAQELLCDEALSAEHRGLLWRELAAFQLGSVAADGRVASGDGREVTHFFAYGEPIMERPWRLMLERYPGLRCVRGEAHMAFVAGYVAHLVMDEAWALKMARPRFWEREWPGVDMWDKFFALHLLLTVMDERDELALAGWQADSLRGCEPCGWLPFMSDGVLRHWRDMLAGQLGPAGRSMTLEIFGARLGIEASCIRAVLDDAELMEERLWRHVSRGKLWEVERDGYVYTREQLGEYLSEALGEGA